MSLQNGAPVYYQTSVLTKIQKESIHAVSHNVECVQFEILQDTDWRVSACYENTQLTARLNVSQLKVLHNILNEAPTLLTIG